MNTEHHYLAFLADVEADVATIALMTRWLRDSDLPPVNGFQIEIRQASYAKAGAPKLLDNSLDRGARILRTSPDFHAWLGGKNGWAMIPEESAQQLAPHWFTREYACAKHINGLFYVDIALDDPVVITEFIGNSPGCNGIEVSMSIAGNMVVTKQTIYSLCV